MAPKFLVLSLKELGKTVLAKIPNVTGYGQVLHPSKSR